ncbi:addiction module toxin RelE [Pseudomonas sp. FSL R10-1350]|uniref:type II toxin-antitoxin system RelE/ParE family toxin n=1 Tax=Pseudomonas sp. FSL R10-1350 TaxID=2662197 RepID=UPI001296C06F|nr:type II toxin-antitoxin system RelE/ParE family toxin [Pseudomonas sp. FSL R10-1350]MQU66044.1 addiction module toxin RelE [Pseudomonas sp. FSL R10-1350]
MVSNWEVEYTDEFGCWWEGLEEKEQVSVAASVKLLGQLGPGLRYPHSSDIKGSRHGNLRELRIQHAGRPYRVLYVFDPRRCALLLLGDDKTGRGRWYEEHIPQAERLYDEHLETLLKEGREHG